MPDITRLAAGLDEYVTALGRHRTLVDEGFREVERTWAALSDVYAGAAAEEFSNHWRGTEQMFHSYIEEMALLKGFLEAKAAGLSALDSTGHPVL
jgi:hypothetical protein